MVRAMREWKKMIKKKRVAFFQTYILIEWTMLLPVSESVASFKNRVLNSRILLIFYLFVSLCSIPFQIQSSYCVITE